MNKDKVSIQKYNLASLIATYLRVGYIKYCPGTFGSLATFPLFLILNFFILKLKLTLFYQLSIIYCAFIIFLFIIGYWSTSIYIAFVKESDPSEVVIDEVIGQTISFSISTISVLYYTYSLGISHFSLLYSIFMVFSLIIGPIIFFRLFDILKPGLVGYFDTKVKGALGILMDDVIAGIYAGLSMIVIITLFFILTALR